MRVLVVVQNAQERGRLRAGMARLHRMVVVDAPEAETLLATGRGVDAVIVDARGLSRLGRALRAARRAARPAPLPVLLLGAPGERLARAELGVTVDEVLRRPIDPVEVQARLRTAATLRRGVAGRPGSGAARARRPAPGEGASGAAPGETLAPPALRDALAHADLATWVWDVGSQQMRWGRGAPGDPLAGAGGIHPDDRGTLVEAIARARSAGVPVDVEVREVLPDGGERWIEFKGEAVRDAAGRVGDVVGVALDVTARRRAQDAVAASEERFRALAEQSFEPILLLDRHGIIRYASPTAGRLLTPDRLVGQSWHAAIHPDDRERGRRTFAEALAHPGDASTATVRIARPGGSWAWVESVVRNLLDHPHVRAVVVNSRDVTDRMEAEAALRVAELRQRRVAEVTSDFAFTLRRGDDEVGLVLDWVSESFPRITGYDLETVEAGGGFEQVVWHEGDVHLWRRAARRVLAGESAAVEARAVRPDGSVYWLRAYARPLRDGGDGIVTGVYGAGQDVTERKRLEEERERLASVVDATSDFVAVADASARVLYLNRAAREALALGDVDDAAPLTLAECHTGASAERLRAEAIPVALERGRWFGTLAWRGAGGREIPVSQVVMAHRGESGRVDFLASVARDIQDHLDAEAALRRQAQQLEEQAHVLDLAHVLVVDRDGRIQRWTRGAEALYGWSAAEALGRRPEELLGTETPVPPSAIDAELAASGRWEGELVQHTKDGRRIVVASHWVLHRDAAGAPLAVLQVSNDITSQKRLQTELAASREELRAFSNHLQSALEEERTRIAREIHDELGQQLTGLKMDVAWLGTRIAKLDVPQVAELSDKTQAMRELVDEAVRSVRRTATDLRPVVLDDLGLVAALEWLAGEFTTRTGIPCEFGADEPGRRYERELATALFRIAQEALTNVARHAAAGRVMVRLWQDGSHLVLEVRDDGRGIGANGSRGERSLGVLGMKERARLLGGEVTLSGRAGEGTTVTARLPVGGTTEGYSPSTSRMA